MRGSGLSPECTLLLMALLLLAAIMFLLFFCMVSLSGRVPLYLAYCDCFLEKPHSSHGNLLVYHNEGGFYRERALSWMYNL